MVKFDSHIRARLREGREAGGLTLEAIAARIDYSKSTISNVENGKDKPGRRLYEKLLTAYGIRREWVEKGEGEMWTQRHLEASGEVGKMLGLSGAGDIRASKIESPEIAALGSLAKNLLDLRQRLELSIGGFSAEIKAFEYITEKLARKLRLKSGNGRHRAHRH